METRHPITVLIIEDHPIVREGCQLILSERSDMEVIEATTAADGLALNKFSKPDIIVLDIGLPDASGIDIMPKLHAENAKAAIIVFSMCGTKSFVTSAFKKGAVGFLTKNDDPKAFLAAIEKTRGGEIYLGQAVAQKLAMTSLTSPSHPLADLRKRERQIIAALGKGHTSMEIAAELDLSYKSVANAISIIKQKLNITSMAALVKFAVELNVKSDDRR
jgi:two-component system, NarL family, invasion response regulator UvrY